ncbi:MAG: hypothetical protein A2289_18890 [Deltaproteobacteria bacterium RIFOXYA12_FULL_58_15]|nr:MAG: hypothetical protein A2289_18890 [Deltaproteobacteria bacterium RIFOXYA12_FULL_58_15]OGR08686.1 MAG: hypothetical protein A2341_00635 [Deltaproteobacteria bacterium RIFOXYB12_FULL_58_9]
MAAGGVDFPFVAGLAELSPSDVEETPLGALIFGSQRMVIALQLTPQALGRANPCLADVRDPFGLSANLLDTCCV